MLANIRYRRSSGREGITWPGGEKRIVGKGAGEGGGDTWCCWGIEIAKARCRTF